MFDLYSQKLSDDKNGEGDADVLVKTKTKTKRPPLYKVLLLNDDYTPMEFVVIVLERFFGLNHAQAFEIMLTVHKKVLLSWVCLVTKLLKLRLHK